MRVISVNVGLPRTVQWKGKAVSTGIFSKPRCLVGSACRLRRWGKPHDPGGTAIFLAPDAAAYITAQQIIVDGAQSGHWPDFLRCPLMTQSGHCAVRL